MTFWLVVLGTAPRWSRDTFHEAFYGHPKVIREVPAGDIEDREARWRRMAEHSDPGTAPGSH